MIMCIGLRVGFSPSFYNVDEDAGSVSVCASVYDVSGAVQYTPVTMATTSYTYGARTKKDSSTR